MKPISPCLGCCSNCRLACLPRARVRACLLQVSDSRAAPAPRRQVRVRAAAYGFVRGGTIARQRGPPRRHCTGTSAHRPNSQTGPIWSAGRFDPSDPFCRYGRPPPPLFARPGACWPWPCRREQAGAIAAQVAARARRKFDSTLGYPGEGPNHRKAASAGSFGRIRSCALGVQLCRKAHDLGSEFVAIDGTDEARTVRAASTAAAATGRVAAAAAITASARQGHTHVHNKCYQFLRQPMGGGGGRGRAGARARGSSTAPPTPRAALLPPSQPEAGLQGRSAAARRPHAHRHRPAFPTSVRTSAAPRPWA